MLVHSITHGGHRNDIERDSIRNYSTSWVSTDERVLNKIVKQNRKKADKRAEPRTERDENKYVMNDIRKLDCDPNHKPVDAVTWGNPTFMNLPSTSYAMTYQDP